MKKVEFHKGGMFVKGKPFQIEDSELFEGPWRLLNDVRDTISRFEDYLGSDFGLGSVDNNVQFAVTLSNLRNLEHDLNNIRIGNTNYFLYDVEWSSHHTGKDK